MKKKNEGWKEIKKTKEKVRIKEKKLNICNRNTYKENKYKK